MIITLTLNPAIDHTVVVDSLVLGDTNRVTQSRTDPGGKGINVSRVIHTLGQESLALGFVAGGLGRFIEHALREQGIFEDFIHVPGQTRTNITIIHSDSNIRTAINERGPEIALQHVSGLHRRIKKHLTSGNWLVVGGSVPPPISPSIYADIVLYAKKKGGYTVLDADGEALSQGLTAKPYMVKPNRRELQRLLKRELRTLDDILKGAEEVHDYGIPVVVVSMGEEGAIGISDQGRWRGVPPKVERASPAGSGDALVAGLVLVLSQGGSLDEGLRLGTAAAAATCLTPGTQLCHRDDVERLLPQVQVYPL